MTPKELGLGGKKIKCHNFKTNTHANSRINNNQYISNEHKLSSYLINWIILVRTVLKLLTSLLTINIAFYIYIENISSYKYQKGT